MQAELKALQQQALATQQSLQQLQTRKEVDPYSAITSGLPGMATVDGALLGVGSALLLAGVLVWWYVWQRPRNRWIDADLQSATAMATPPNPPQAKAEANTSVSPSESAHYSPAGDSQDWAPSTSSGEFSIHGFESSNPFARQDPNMAFDSEAAATEVMRVRKSLAEKREARAQFLEREDAPESLRSADSDLDLDLDLDEVPPPPEAVTPAQPEPDLDLDLDPWRQPGETALGPTQAQPADAIHFSLALEDYGAKPAEPAHTPAIQPPLEIAMDPVPEAIVPNQASLAVARVPANVDDSESVLSTPESKGYDFTITMALAQESAALELWNEARDLATEVLASDDRVLVAQARALLERVNQLEQDAPPDTNWGAVR